LPTRRSSDLTVYERIKDISKKRGMSLQTVAKAAGLSQNMIYQYKNVNPKMDTLKTLADVLGVSTDYLLGNTDDMHANKKSDNVINLDEALSDKGVVMEFQGKELSYKAKRGILEILNLIDGNEE